MIKFFKWMLEIPNKPKRDNKPMVEENPITKLYIAGPMSGKENLNEYEFNNAEELFRTYYDFDDIFNPAKSPASRLVVDQNITGQEAYRLCMALDLKYICEEATHIYMLKGWENSPGAKAEHATAVCLGLKIMYE